MRIRILGHRIIVLLGITLMMAECGTSPTSPRPSPRGEGGACRTLMGIDSLMWQQPDSAFALLQAFAAGPEADSLDEFSRHYFQLLVSELLYKNYYEQSNRSELIQAVRYFDSLSLTTKDKHHNQRLHRELDSRSPVQNDNLVFLTARAHYINGVGYYERDSVVEACEEYLIAWELMEKLINLDNTSLQNTQFIALTLTRLTDLFSDIYLHEQAIYFSRLSLTYYQKLNEPAWYVSRMLCEIGTHYNILNIMDSADYYYQQALSVLPDTNNLLHRDLIAYKSYMLYKREGLSQTPLDLLYLTIERAESEKEYLSRCLTLGEIYYHENQYDSAWKYLDKVYESTKDKDSKKQAAEWLVELCKIQGKEKDILGYADFLIPFVNQEENQSEVKSQLTELYKDFGQKRQERMHQQAKEQYTKRSVVVIGTLSALISVVAFLYFWHKRKGELLKAQIKEEKDSHKQQQKALSGRLKQKNQEVRELKVQVNQKDETTKIAKAAASFAEEPICRLIIERVNEGRFKSKMDCEVYKEYALDKQSLLDLRLAADRHYRQFTVRLKKAYPELTNTDLDYCCLYLLGLTNADIAALMQRAYNTVTERDGKLRKIIGNSNPLSKTLSEIANGSLSVDL